MRDFVIKKTQEINPLAFGDKYNTLNKKGEKKVLHTRGCRCKKTQCDRNYCECFKVGIGCSNVCKCNNCKNMEFSLKKEEVQKIF